MFKFALRCSNEEDIPADIQGQEALTDHSITGDEALAHTFNVRSDLQTERRRV